MSGRNDFLAQFMEMRRAIPPATAAQAVAAQMPASKKAKKLSKQPLYSEGGVASIIEHKPGRKAVEEFLQDKCNKLTAEKMA